MKQRSIKFKVPDFFARLFPEDIEQKTAGFISLEMPRSSTSASEHEYDRISDYSDFIEAFKKLPWVYAGSTALAIASVKPELKLYIRKKEGNKLSYEDAYDERIYNLFQRPNPFRTWRHFIQIACINLSIVGEHFINIVGHSQDQPISEHNLPIELWWMKPSQIEIVKDREKFIAKYRYLNPGGGESIDLDPSEVSHIISPDPDDYFRGLGAMQPAKNSAILDFNAQAFNKNFIQNDGVPHFLFKTPEKMTDKQAQQFRRYWNNQHQGASKAGNFGLIYGDIEVDKLGSTPKDVQYNEMQKINREIYLATLHVPPSIVGLLEYANYANMEVQESHFWNNAVMPILNNIADQLTFDIAFYFNPDYVLRFDYSQIEALQENEKEKSDIACALVSNRLMTPNEARKRFYNAEPYEGGDVIYIPMSMIPLEIAENSSPGKEDKTKSLKGKKPSFWQLESNKKLLWESFVKRVEMRERPFVDKLKTYLMKEAQEIVNKIKRHKTSGDIVPQSVYNEVKASKLYVKKFYTRYVNIFTEAGKSGISASAGKLYIEEKQEGGEFMFLPEHQATLEAMVLESGTQLSKTTMTKVLNFLKTAQQESWTVEQLAQEIDVSLSQLSITRSRLIARTESVKVENYGVLMGYKQSENVELKGWLCAFVEKSRSAHMDADAEYSDNPIPLNDPFIVGGEALQYPGDPSGSPGNVCNCLCTTYPEVRTL